MCVCARVRDSEMSVCAGPPLSNMFPAWRRKRRTGGSMVAPPRTMVFTAGQVAQVWVSCWILLSATCILGARAQGKMRNFFKSHIAAVVGGGGGGGRQERRTRKYVACRKEEKENKPKTVPNLKPIPVFSYNQT